MYYFFYFQFLPFQDFFCVVEKKSCATTFFTHKLFEYTLLNNNRAMPPKMGNPPKKAAVEQESKGQSSKDNFKVRKSKMCSHGLKQSGQSAWRCVSLLLVLVLPDQR